MFRPSLHTTQTTIHQESKQHIMNLKILQAKLDRVLVRMKKNKNPTDQRLLLSEKHDLEEQMTVIQTQLNQYNVLQSHLNDHVHLQKMGNLAKNMNQILGPSTMGKISKEIDKLGSTIESTTEIHTDLLSSLNETVQTEKREDAIMEEQQKYDDLELLEAGETIITSAIASLNLEEYREKIEQEYEAKYQAHVLNTSKKK